MGDKFIIEVDPYELAVRLIECEAEIKRPPDTTGKEAFAQIIALDNPHIRHFAAVCLKQAEVCWEYVTECINENGARVQ